MAEIKQNSIPGVPVVSHAELLRGLTKKIEEVRAMKMTVAQTAIAGNELTLGERSELRTNCQRVSTQLREIVLALS